MKLTIRALNENDLDTWLELSHESDELVSQLLPDISVFYEGFDEYMAVKIRQTEAFMAVDELTQECLGITAFSKTNNRISYLGVSSKADFDAIGSKLFEFSINQLDTSKAIAITVLNTKLPLIQRERALYEHFGFVETDNTILEASIPACLMIKTPSHN